MPDPSSAPGSRLPLPSLGPRGEGWVILQVVLVAAVAAAGIWGPAWSPPATTWRQLVAGVVALVGAALAVAAGLTLGRQLTPLPRPMEGGGLRDRGAYALARHPMYGGVLLVALGWALFTSPLALVPAAAGGPFLDAKRRLEEAWLAQRHPGYADYQRRVRWRLIPFVW
jgi:protein-S-isoprenylcysteine O-methyltransferase Ste14